MRAEGRLDPRHLHVTCNAQPRERRVRPHALLHRDDITRTAERIEETTTLPGLPRRAGLQTELTGPPTSPCSASPRGPPRPRPPLADWWPGGRRPTRTRALRHVAVGNGGTGPGTAPPTSCSNELTRRRPPIRRRLHSRSSPRVRSEWAPCQSSQASGWARGRRRIPRDQGFLRSARLQVPIS
jgi:hypothetical protein